MSDDGVRSYSPPSDGSSLSIAGLGECVSGMAALRDKIRNGKPGEVIPCTKEQMLALACSPMTEDDGWT